MRSLIRLEAGLIGLILMAAWLPTVGRWLAAIAH